MRPVLTPAARRLWRDRETLQLGRDGRAAVLGGVDEGVRAMLALLDGTRDRAQVLAAADSAGCPADRASTLLAVLETAGLLADAGSERAALAGLERPERERLGADLASLSLVRRDGGHPAVQHRRSVRVLVHGGGRVGAPLAAMLAAAGVGAVHVEDDAPARPEDAGVGGLRLSDVGRRRGEAAREHLTREQLGGEHLTREHPRGTCPSVAGDADTADLVVLAPGRPDQLDEARRRLPPGVPHLLAEVRDTVGVVGPLVLPGRSACLRCTDLTRTDLDPAWPALAAQLSMPSRHRDACDGPLAVMVAAQAALQVLLLVDGTADPASVGGTLELALPDWRWRRRSWPLHPMCGCAPDAAA